MNMNDYEKVKLLDETCARIGLFVKRNQYSGYGEHAKCFLAVSEEEGPLPVFSRGTELFGGTVEECISWLSGFIRAGEYYKILLNKTPADVEKSEQKYLLKLQQRKEQAEQQRLYQILKTGKDPEKK
jgi:hypothetical protein